MLFVCDDPKTYFLPFDYAEVRCLDIESGPLVQFLVVTRIGTILSTGGPRVSGHISFFILLLRHIFTTLPSYLVHSTDRIYSLSKPPYKRP